MDEAALPDKLMTQNSKDYALFRNQSLLSTASDNSVQVYSVNRKELIKQAHLEFSNP